ncbi:MAG TPA: FG-GAP and VCBS repeat-containing protein [Candidatus Limnocylindria bacterium]|nr:FG-GAP and VCBS repeat-containing protein [Candidatus Limnocylindria bacterium]
MTFRIVAVAAAGTAICFAADVPEPKFRAVTIDDKIQIGYGVATADVDGDGKPDIVLADQKQFVWYRNPNWEKFILAENLTKLDNVCITARDIDGDGKAEIAVGGGWNPGDTIGSGAVFYLVAPADRTQKWEAIALPHVPTIHRMRWVESPRGGFELLSVPLHGYGNKNGEGEGVPIMTYREPTDPRQPWETNVITKQWHKTHNFDPIGPGRAILIASKEGIFQIDRLLAQVVVKQLATNDIGGIGEVRSGNSHASNRFVAAIEPMHGTNVTLFTSRELANLKVLWTRRVLDSSLVDGHALACGDLLGLGRDQIVAGWRAMSGKAKVGIKFYTPLADDLKEWRTTLVDDNGMACEDLCLADLNGDGKLDIVAAGRATKNVKVYFNESAR